MAVGLALWWLLFYAIIAGMTLIIIGMLAWSNRRRNEA